MQQNKLIQGLLYHDNLFVNKYIKCISILIWESCSSLFTMKLIVKI